MMIKIIESTDDKNLGMIIELNDSIILESDFVFKDYSVKYIENYIIIYNDNYIIKGILI